MTVISDHNPLDPIISPQDVTEANEILPELEKAAEQLQSSSRSSRGADELVQALRQTELWCDPPQIKRLTPSADDTFDYYAMRFTVNLKPGRAIRFALLELQIALSAEGSIPRILALFPEKKWRDVFQWGASFNVDVDEQFHLHVNPISQISSTSASPVSASISTDVGGTATFSLGRFEYKFGTFEVISVGEDSSRCFWRIEKSAMQSILDCPFLIIFSVPKGCPQVSLNGQVAAGVEVEWLTGQLEGVFEQLKEKVRTFFINLLHSKKPLPLAKSIELEVSLPSIAPRL